MDERFNLKYVWNSLSNNCKQAELVTTFKCKLKSELFYFAKVPLIRFRRTTLYKFAVEFN